ncbi:MAG: LytTR family DNA-binding domain-containing protein [Taibaiella sp.]|nr:LytTR family DNA-binding domain-containing protein [Taibaiella sp.]
MHTNSKALSVLIVDDEKDACENLKYILSEYIEEPISVMGVANSTREAEDLINKKRPDAIFLDIEMPKENAFEFLERVSPVNFEIVFVTAYDDYAIRAFKLNAVDYILKPISIPELSNAVKRLSERVSYKKLIQKPSETYNDIGRQINNRSKALKITLRETNTIEIVEFKHILFLEAHGSYSRVIFLKNDVSKEKIMSVSLSDYEELLPPDMFYRIHKSYLINRLHVNNIIRDDIGQVVVNNEFTLPVSRRRLATLIDFLKNND